MPGPPPKKDAERRRRNKTSAADGSLSHIPAEVVDLDQLMDSEVVIPQPDEKWHHIARLLWDAQRESGQVMWMEPSDWALLYMMCESISRDMKTQPIGVHPETGAAVMAKVPLKGASLSSYIKLANQLLMTEGGRRLLRIELERKKRLDEQARSAEVVSIAAKRSELFKQNTGA